MILLGTSQDDVLPYKFMLKIMLFLEQSKSPENNAGDFS